MTEVMRQETTGATAAVRAGSARRTLPVLGGLMALGPLSVDMYLPALPGIRAELAATPATIQLTITGVMVGMGLGQLIVGPLSDAIGRHRPLLAGLIVYVIGSLLCVVAPDATLLVAARILQGVAISTAGVIATASVRDLYSGSRLARVLSRLMIIPMAAPVVAPTIGSGLLSIAPWRGVFVVLGAVGLAMLIIVAVSAPRDVAPGAPVRGAERPLRLIMMRSVEAYRLLLGDRQYVAAAVIIGAAMAALMGYVAGAPFVLQGSYGLDQHQFGLVFGAGGVSLIISGQLNAHLLRRYPPERILRVAVLAGVPTVGWLAVAASTGTGGLAGLLIGLWLLLGVIGMVFPNAPAVAMSRHGERAGSAAALIGGVQFGLGAAGAPVVGLLGNTEAALVAVAAAGMLIAAGTVILARVGRRSEP
ncbi:multidrug effflux MFS transporter [Microlunatus soli]|uniref:MFS transporter, DHA1 family, bicyclomycin/chloramphenicol resistance protein n=1 Tax=Microlunatus soli TaxID=630515 RepID=A0A1H1NSH2_9ACTN|nr:multidrug effflux MFS transporter [Microlunatus soli]SDS01750.1 MFS transporter, DHA1 family, bicyclomycin/chloramphenicol resistance protein [Microlunatus soli]